MEIHNRIPFSFFDYRKRPKGLHRRLIKYENIYSFLILLLGSFVICYEYFDSRLDISICTLYTNWRDHAFVLHTQYWIYSALSGCWRSFGRLLYILSGNSEYQKCIPFVNMKNTKKNTLWNSNSSNNNTRRRKKVAYCRIIYKTLREVSPCFNYLFKIW